MLLLAMKFLKDAAKAAKRICIEAFRPAGLAEGCAFTEMLGITTLKVVSYMFGVEEGVKILHLWCSHVHDVGLCPRCAAVSDVLCEEERRCVRHLNTMGMITFLHFLSRRFRCDQCGKLFTEELSFAEPYRRQTVAFEKYIYELCKASSRKTVAQREALSQSTVKDILKRGASKLEVQAGSILTRTLGIDEISLKKRHKQFALIISDIDRKCVLAVLEARDKERLRQWIVGLDVRQREAIEHVAIDMWRPYQQVARAELPRARITADRFHVMKQLNERISQIRRKIQNNGDESLRQLLKGSRWLLVRNRSELESEEEERLGEILSACAELRTLYLFKEEFRLIFEKVTDKAKAQRFLLAWKIRATHTANKYLLKFVATLENWWEEILNYFTERITSGAVEGLNNAIRGIIRRAFGYRNFENFKLVVFAEQGPAAKQSAM